MGPLEGERLGDGRGLEHVPLGEILQLSLLRDVLDEVVGRRCHQDLAGVSRAARARRGDQRGGGDRTGTFSPLLSTAVFSSTGSGTDPVGDSWGCFSMVAAAGSCEGEPSLATGAFSRGSRCCTGRRGVEFYDPQTEAAPTGEGPILMSGGFCYPRAAVSPKCPTWEVPRPTVSHPPLAAGRARAWNAMGSQDAAMPPRPSGREGCREGQADSAGSPVTHASRREQVTRARIEYGLAIAEGLGQ